MTFLEEIIHIRRHIHKNPEIGFNTFNTAKYIKDLLDKLGYETNYVLNKAGVIAKLNLNKEKTLGFRSDIDALPIVENTGLDYSSTNSYMHACGHDAHAAMLLGAAKLFIQNKDKLKYNITLVFQPAEEGPLPGGAFTLLNEFNLDYVDEFYAFHVTNKFDIGTFAIKPGQAFSAPDFFKVKVVGKGSHGAKPEEGINPNLIISEIILKLNELANTLNKTTKCVLQTTTINSGSAYNIIPDEANCGGTIRTFDEETRRLFTNEGTKICNEIALKYKAKATFTHDYGYDSVYNHEDSAYHFADIAKSTKGINNIIILDEPDMVGEDFAYYLKNHKGAIGWLGVCSKNSERIDLHSPNFALDENALEIGSNIFLNMASNK